jgi:flagellar capping protein FliD
MDNGFDFGFTLVDENELDVVQKSTDKVTNTQTKLDELYNAITPLLNNLKANPEREYIKWPDRVEKVEQFEEYISKIYSK